MWDVSCSPSPQPGWALVIYIYSVRVAGLHGATWLQIRVLSFTVSLSLKPSDELLTQPLNFPEAELQF